MGRQLDLNDAATLRAQQAGQRAVKIAIGRRDGTVHSARRKLVRIMAARLKRELNNGR
jgi:hypothetical protein